jgi:hypothetical protein
MSQKLIKKQSIITLKRFGMMGHQLGLANEENSVIYSVDWGGNLTISISLKGG